MQNLLLNELLYLICFRHKLQTTFDIYFKFFSSISTKIQLNFFSSIAFLLLASLDIVNRSKTQITIPTSLEEIRRKYQFYWQEDYLKQRKLNGKTTPNGKEENYVTFFCVSFIDHHTTIQAEKMCVEIHINITKTLRCSRVQPADDVQILR